MHIVACSDAVFGFICAQREGRICFEGKAGNIDQVDRKNKILSLR